MLRVTPANSTGTVTPPGPVTFSVVTDEAITCGFPVVMPNGPADLSIPTAGLFGKAAANCERPVGVGVRFGRETEGTTPVKRRSQNVLPKKNSLSLSTGPPRVAP